MARKAQESNVRDNEVYADSNPIFEANRQM